MVSKDERGALWLAFQGSTPATIARLEELAFIDLVELEAQVRARRDSLASKLTDYQIAAELRHEALRLLTERRRRTEELPLAAAFGGRL